MSVRVYDVLLSLETITPIRCVSLDIRSSGYLVVIWIHSDPLAPSKTPICGHPVSSSNQDLIVEQFSPDKNTLIMSLFFLTRQDKTIKLIVLEGKSIVDENRLSPHRRSRVCRHGAGCRHGGSWRGVFAAADETFEERTPVVGKGNSVFVLPSWHLYSTRDNIITIRVTGSTSLKHTLGSRISPPISPNRFFSLPVSQMPL